MSEMRKNPKEELKKGKVWLERDLWLPAVYKSDKYEMVVIIYLNKAEYFGGSETGKRIITDDDFDPFFEIESLKEKGFKRVHEDKELVG